MAVDNNSSCNLVVGVDASNLRRGGGLTHLIELLSAAEPDRFGINRVVVWGPTETISKLAKKSWLQLESPTVLNGGTLRRLVWQRFCLVKAATRAGCHILFVPGGNHSGGELPVVTMSRNMLPFEWCELKRYGVSLTTLRLLALRQSQTRSFRRAEGVIFLNEYARTSVCKFTGVLSAATAIIPHGRNERFEFPPKPQLPIESYNSALPFKMIYVSIVDEYKHQWHVVEAVGILRRAGYPVQLDLVGPAYPPAMTRLKDAIDKHDPTGVWVKYHGPVAYEILHQMYAEANLGIFASSCENMPNILIETMSAGLPIACSNRGPMPEILGPAGLYFNPEDGQSIACALQTLISSVELRLQLAQASYLASKQYTWTRCAYETFSMLSTIGNSNRGKLK